MSEKRVQYVPQCYPLWVAWIYTPSIAAGIPTDALEGLARITDDEIDKDPRKFVETSNAHRVVAWELEEGCVPVAVAETIGSVEGRAVFSETPQEIETHIAAYVKSMRDYAVHELKRRKEA